MDKDFLVLHTPGAFGNFMAYLIDCHIAGEMLPEPFIESGASHARSYSGTTQSMDVLIPGLWKEVETSKNVLVGCVWELEHYKYILHAYYSRTNIGQYGRCGIEYCQDNFFDFVARHQASDRLQQDIVDLQSLFGLVISEENKQVPRHVLRMFFWHKMIEEEANIVVAENSKIKNYPGVDLIDIADIIDHGSLCKWFTERFNKCLDFEETHKNFIKHNRSLMEYNKAQALFGSVVKGENVAIGELTAMGEAMLLYDLEKHYFDIPFFNQTNFFENTKEIIDYVKYFPMALRQPNKLFHKHYRRFRPNE